MSALASIKLSSDLVADARKSAPVFSRSIGGQVEHWARLGQAIESAPGFTFDRIQAALDGRFDPSDLSADEWRIYDDLAFESLAHATDTEDAAYIALGVQPGAVGINRQGQLVRLRSDGSAEELPDESQ